MTSRGDAVSRPARRPAAPLSHRVVLATGWTRRGLALLAGACGALAMAPVGFVPAMAVSLTVAVWLIDGAERTATSRSGARRHLGPTLRSAFSAGWWWGFGFFTAGLHWLGAAFLVDADKTAWLMPLGVVGLPAVLGIYAGCAFALARALWSAGPARLLALGFALLVTELLRGSLFTGFPWNEIGMALGSNLVLAQGASVIGLHGLTALAVPVFAAPATLADRDGAGRRNLAPTLLAALTLIGLAAFGVWRLAGGPAGDVPGVRLRIMQPDVFGDGEFTYENKDALLAKYLALSDRATSPDRTGLADVTHLIWPESPFPFILSRDPDALDAIGRILPKGTVLVTGAARVEGSQGSPANPPRYFNAIQVLEHDPASGAAAVGDTYDKVHLVPFGEYTPFLGLMERLGISQFVPIPGGFTPGPPPPTAPRAGPAAGRARRLLRSHLLGGARAPGRRGPRPGGHPERVRRRLVRPHGRALAAPRPGAAARRGARFAAGPRRQYRRVGHHRPLWPHPRRVAVGRSRSVGRFLAEKHRPDGFF